MPDKRSKGLILLGAALLAALAWGFWPRATDVETAAVARRPLVVSVEEEARTRVRERYVIHAPVSGQLRRIDLHVGDPVQAGAVVASLDPALPAVLDPRSRAETEARAAAARAELARREAGSRQAAAEAELAVAEFARLDGLVARGLVSQREFDQAQASLRAREAARRAAESAVQVGRYDLEAARAALRFTAAGGGGKPVGTVTLRSPVEGRVLRLHQESAGVVAAGQALLEVGDPRDLEVESEVLSRDAVRLEPGGRVRLERWGGDAALEGLVRTVEPTGFTKVSALGIEEQRVRVIVDIRSPPEAWRRLGDGYRVDARFLVHERADALTVPTSALFRHDGGQAVFVVEGGRARLRPVTTGEGGGLLTEITLGLETGETVIAHPGEALGDGVRVRALR